MKQRSIFKKAIIFLIFGLELPALVILGLYIGQLLGKRLGSPLDMISALAGSLIGLLIGSLIIIWVTMKLYKKQSQRIIKLYHSDI